MSELRSTDGDRWGQDFRYTSRPCHYDAQVNVRDRYSWDGGRATPVGSFTVSDASLAALHRGGIARE